MKKRALELILLIDNGGTASDLADWMNELDTLTVNQAQIYLPAVAGNVDFCLMLPLKPGQFWKLTGKIAGNPESKYEAYIADVNRSLSGLSLADMWFSHSLPLVMLWYWWKMQPDAQGE